MEITILNWIQENLHEPVVDWLMILFTRLGEAGFVWIVLGVLMLCFRKSRKYGLLMLLSLLFTYLLGELLLKNIICRPRPFQSVEGIGLLIPAPWGYAFPSGHAGSSFAAAWILCKFNRKAGAAGLVLAVLIAFSRLYLYVHYPTDVLAGMVLGVLVAQTVYSVARRYFSFGIEARAEKVLRYRG